MKNNLFIGPFADNKKALEKFGSNIYLNYLYAETIDELFQAEKELDIAKQLKTNEEEIILLEERIKFLESVVTLATKNFINDPIEDENYETNQRYYD